MTKKRVLTQEHFDALLAWLSPNREQAGEKYEHIRHSLIKLYTWQGYSDAEDLADETINRVTFKLAELREGYVGDPALYFYGVARKMMAELHRREAARASLREDELEDRQPDDDVNEFEAVYECLDACIKKLSPANRKLVLRYYQKEKKAKIDFRREVAQQLGIEINNLRL